MSNQITLASMGEVKTLLSGCIGQPVVICNQAYADSQEGQVGFVSSGKLEECEDDGGYFVRCAESYWGPEGVSFWPQNVLEAERLSCGTVRIRIILKGGGK